MVSGFGQLFGAGGGGLSSSSSSSASQRSTSGQSGSFGDINFAEKSLDKNVRNGLILAGVVVGVIALFRMRK